MFDFFKDVRAMATTLVAAAITVMALGVTAVVGDHVWLLGQQEALRASTDSAAIAGTHELNRQVSEDPDIRAREFRPSVRRAAMKHIYMNLQHLPETRVTDLDLEIRRGAGSHGSVDVEATSELGGNLISNRLPLFYDAGPKQLRAGSTVECDADVVEVVFALDATGSMREKFHPDPNLPGARKIEMAVQSIRDAMDVLLGSACADLALGIGVVPYTTTVNVGKWHQRWRESGRVDLSNYYDRFEGTNVPGEEHIRLRQYPWWAWAGCLEERHIDIDNLANPATSPGLSIAPPEEIPFRAYMYPDSSNMHFDAIRDVLDDILAEHPDLDPESVEERLRNGSDNPWPPDGEIPSDAFYDNFRHSGRSSTRPGPSKYCIQAPMHPLASNNRHPQLHETLDDILDANLFNQGTMLNLGITWARRMLHPSWHPTWTRSNEARIHPVDPADYPPGRVRKYLVIVSDGMNHVGDTPRKLPGNLYWYREPGKELKFDDDDECEEYPSCRSKDERVSVYTALGRITEFPDDDGLPEDGHYYGSSSFWGDDVLPGERLYGVYLSGRMEYPFKGLDTLMLESCNLAHEEGITIYTIGIYSVYVQHEFYQWLWRQSMHKCSGGAGMTLEERKQYYYHTPSEGEATAAFKEVARRLVTLRRVH